MTRSLAALAAAVLCAPLLSAGNNELHAAAETQLGRALNLAGSGRWNEAVAEIEGLVAKYPNFRLAHLVHGDLLLAKAGSVHGANAPAPVTDRLRELRAELVWRLRHHLQLPAEGSIPRYLLRLDATQSHAIVVDTTWHRAYVFENAGGIPKLVRDYYTTIGKHGVSKQREGDKRTPIGAYHVVAHIPGSKLPDLYGWGAFPIDYPNEWDRRQGRTGNGIWIHGVPAETYARAPRASDGCVALANPEIEDLAARVQPGLTPVVIADGIEWLAPDVWRSESEAFIRQLEAWRHDWESLNETRYLAHYARSFATAGMDRNAWAARKRRANEPKLWVRIELGAVSVLRSPDKEPVIVASFDQYYRSNTLSSRSRKRQYWVVEDGRWKIAHEAVVGRGSTGLPDSFPDRRRYARR